MTAEDVKTTLELACSSSLLNQSSDGLIGKIKGSEDYFVGKTKTISGIKIINPYCLEISLNLPNYNFPKLLSSPKYAIFSQRALAYYKEDIRFHPVGTGPFSLKSTTAEEIVLTYNPVYWKRDSFGNVLPYLDEIRYNVYSNNQEEILAFQRQQIDFLFGLPTEKINSIFTPLNNINNYLPFAHKVHVVPGSRVHLIVLNQKSAFFGDSRVRKAIDLVLDRDYLASELLNGDGIAANQGIAPASFYYDNSMIPKTRTNVVLGKTLMAEAGFGIHKPFPTLDFYTVGKDIEQVQKYCAYVVNQLKKHLNIDLVLHWVDQEGRLNAIKNGKADIWKLGLNPNYADADAYFGLFYSKNPINQEQNTLFPKINSSIYDINYSMAIQEKNPSKQNNYYTSCDIILNEENWVLPLLYEDYIIIQNLRARGAVISPIGTIDLRSAYIKAL
jgi:peptide/nickel transport system substrate-binding protein